MYFFIYKYYLHVYAYNGAIHRGTNDQQRE